MAARRIRQAQLKQFSRAVCIVCIIFHARKSFLKVKKLTSKKACPQGEAVGAYNKVDDMILIGEWSGFCCGTKPTMLQANLCLPCQSSSPGAELSRDALPRPPERGHHGLVFNSAASAFTGASWPIEQSLCTRRKTPEMMITEFGLVQKDCSAKFPHSRVRCFVVPSEDVIANWHSLDVMSYTGPYISETRILAPRLPWQLRAVINMESVQYWPHMMHPDVRSAYDIHVGIHRRLVDGPNLQVMFEQIGTKEDYNTTLPVRSQYLNGNIAAFISNCKSMNDREAYMKELMKFVQVDSYGSCLNTINKTDENSGGWHDLGFKRKVQNRYMFSLAFENANEMDWVTEKLFDPLMAGSIPIYMGAANVADYLPCANASCVIQVNDYSSPEDLANHLWAVSESDELFNALHAWRKHEFRPEFDELTRLTRLNYQCAVCQRAYEIRTQNNGGAR